MNALETPVVRNSGTRGPALDVVRWRKARELKTRGLSNLQVGLELDPPCGANVVDRGLKRLAKWEARQSDLRPIDTAPRDGTHNVGAKAPT